MDKELIMRADVFVASILVQSEPNKNTAKEYKIKNSWDVRYKLASIRKGDTFHIDGIGNLKVMQIIDYDKEDDFLCFYELIFNCRKVEETAVVPYNPIVALPSPFMNALSSMENAIAIQARYNALLAQDYHRTWE